MDSYLYNQRVAPLSVTLTPAVRRWVDKFREQEAAWASYPEVKEGALYASAIALPLLLTYASPAEVNEFDWKAIQLRSRRFLRDQLGKATELRDLRALTRAMKNLDELTPPPSSDCPLDKDIH